MSDVVKWSKVKIFTINERTIAVYSHNQWMPFSMSLTTHGSIDKNGPRMEAAQSKRNCAYI
jgi:hypothetical protein